MRILSAKKEREIVEAMRRQTDVIQQWASISDQQARVIESQAEQLAEMQERFACLERMLDKGLRIEFVYPQAFDACRSKPAN